MGPLWYADLGLADYQECTEFQKKLVQLRLAGKIEDTILLLEHTPVLTVGTSGAENGLLASEAALERAGVKVYKTDRGGNITYHGPGQIVGYPIFDLRQHNKDAHLLLRNLEQVVIDFLAHYGVCAERSDGLTGVWVGGDKICSIGIAVRRWISYHGFALNINPNYDHWSLINPCGLVGRKVTSLDHLTGNAPGMDEVKEVMAEKIATLYNAELTKVDHQMLIDLAKEVEL